MKKLLILTLASVMCVAFAGIAVAQDINMNVNTNTNANANAFANADDSFSTAFADAYSGSFANANVTKNIAVDEVLEDYASTDMVGYFDKMKIITIDTYKHINVFFNTEIGVSSDGEAETWGQQMNLENSFEDEGGVREETTEVTTVTEKEYKDSYDPGTGDRFPTSVTETETETVATTVQVYDYNERIADITGSINDNAGVAGVNQSPGNMNNQANLSAMAVIAGDEQLIEANGFGVQASLFNVIYSSYSKNTNAITDSISDNNGIVGVNQSSGNINNQFNSAALAAGLGDVTNGALGEATLKQVSADNFLIHYACYKSDTITGSINGNAGIVSVNQASGDMVNQANIHSIAADLN
jgi:hypothetical protein